MSSFPPAVQAGIEFAAELLGSAKRAVVLTGAGLSTPSGIPDFRSEGTGLWSEDEALEVASLSTFRAHPERFYAWFRPLAAQILGARPNEAHQALADLERRGQLQSIATQNVDTLHQKAGTREVIEIHGTIATLTCTQCFQKVDAPPYLAPFVERGVVPVCRQCGAVLKPDVILFGEQLPQAAWLRAQGACRSCDLMIVAGCSLEVLPVAGLPMQALDCGAHLLIINNRPTYLDARADACLEGDVAQILPAIAQKVIHG